MTNNGAFFGSLLGTMNHMRFGDHFMLTRVRSALAASSALDGLEDQWVFESRCQSAATTADPGVVRARVDAALCACLDGLSGQQLGAPTADGVPVNVVWSQLFQHQTHHRGQATTLLPQAGLTYPSFAAIVGVYRSDAGQST